MLALIITKLFTQNYQELKYITMAVFWSAVRLILVIITQLGISKISFCA